MKIQAYKQTCIENALKKQKNVHSKKKKTSNENSQKKRNMQCEYTQTKKMCNVNTVKKTKRNEIHSRVQYISRTMKFILQKSVSLHTKNYAIKQKNMK